MNSLARVLALVFFFCADVQVHAGGKKSEDAHAKSQEKKISELGDKPLLAEKRETVGLSGSTLVLGRGGLVRREGKFVQLIRGSFYFDGSSEVAFKTPFATLRCGGGDCRMLIERKREEVVIQNLRGNIILHRVGEPQEYLLPTATQVTVGAVTAAGFADMEFPQSLPWAVTARDWAALFPGTVKEFKTELETFRPVWQESVEAISHLHLKRAGLEIAAAEKAARDTAASAAQVEKEDAKLRQLFRQKNDLNP